MVAMHGRLPWPSPDDLSANARWVYDGIVAGDRADAGLSLANAEGRLHGPFNAMVLAPAVGQPLQELGAAVRFSTSLPDRAREAAILAVAVHHESSFEWHAHVGPARTAGVTESELAALRAGEVPEGVDDLEGTVLRVVHSMLRWRDLDDRTFREAEARLGVERLVELQVLVGYYEMLAVGLRVFRTPLPANVDGTEGERDT